MKENEILLTLRVKGVEELLSEEKPNYLYGNFFGFVVFGLIFVLFWGLDKTVSFDNKIGHIFSFVMSVFFLVRCISIKREKKPSGDPKPNIDEFSKFRDRCCGDPKRVEQQILTEAEAPDALVSTNLLLTKSYLIVKNCAYSEMWTQNYDVDRIVWAHYPMYTIMRLDEIVYGRHIRDSVNSFIRATKRPYPPPGPVLILYDGYGQRVRYEENSAQDFPVQKLICMLKERNPRADIITDSVIKDNTKVVISDYQNLFDMRL